MKRLIVLTSMFLISLSSFASVTHAHSESLSPSALSAALSKSQHAIAQLNKDDLTIGYGGADVYRTTLVGSQIISA